MFVLALYETGDLYQFENPQSKNFTNTDTKKNAGAHLCPVATHTVRSPPEETVPFVQISEPCPHLLGQHMCETYWSFSMSICVAEP